MERRDMIMLHTGGEWPWEGVEVVLPFQYNEQDSVVAQEPFHYSREGWASELAGPPQFVNPGGEILQLTLDAHGDVLGDYWIGWNGRAKRVHLLFREANSAVLFKLRWGGV